MRENSEKSEFPDSHRFSLTLHTNYSNKSAPGSTLGICSVEKSKSDEKSVSSCRRVVEQHEKPANAKNVIKTKCRYEKLLFLAPELSPSPAWMMMTIVKLVVSSVWISSQSLAWMVIWCICGASTGAKCGRRDDCNLHNGERYQPEHHGDLHGRTHKHTHTHMGDMETLKLAKTLLNPQNFEADPPQSS